MTAPLAVIERKPNSALGFLTITREKSDDPGYPAALAEAVRALLVDVAGVDDHIDVAVATDGQVVIWGSKTRALIRAGDVLVVPYLEDADGERTYYGWEVGAPYYDAVFAPEPAAAPAPPAFATLPAYQRYATHTMEAQLKALSFAPHTRVRFDGLGHLQVCTNPYSEDPETWHGVAPGQWVVRTLDGLKIYSDAAYQALRKG